MNLNARNWCRIFSRWKIPFVGLASGVLILGTASGMAHAAPAKTVDEIQQVKSSLGQLGLYQHPPMKPYGEKSSDHSEEHQDSFIDSSLGLVIPEKNSNQKISVKPFENLVLTGSEQGLNVYSGNGYSYALTDHSTGTNAGYSVIASPNAPTSYKYAITVNGQPAQLSLTPQGRVLVQDSHGTILNHIAPAWAKDAQGRNVKTNYSVEGNILTQHVEHKSSVYPVVADPELVCNWGICDIKFNKAETRLFADGAWAWLNSVCVLGGPPLIAACGIQTAWWMTVAQQARNEGKCVALHNIPPYPYVYDDRDCR